jgi:Glycine zipper 2TM domain
MKKMFLTGLTLATLFTASAPAMADPPSWAPAHGRRDRDEREDRRDYRREVRQEARRDAWRDYRRYDYNRPGPQGRYYAENYYRDGRYYRPVRLTRNDRIYRGNDNRYYCRRSDGTTGLVIGAALGGVIGNSLDRGGSSILGTLLGAGAGAAIGSSIDRGQVVCR